MIRRLGHNSFCRDTTCPAGSIVRHVLTSAALLPGRDGLLLVHAFVLPGHAFGPLARAADRPDPADRPRAPAHRGRQVAPEPPGEASAAGEASPAWIASHRLRLAQP